MMISLMSARLSYLLALVVLAACSRNSEHSTARKVEALIRDNHLKEAMQITDAYIAQHPDAVELLRLRVIIALKVEQLDFAVAALQALPQGDGVLAQALSHRDATVRSNAARLVAEYSIGVDPQLLIRGLSDPVSTVRRYCARELGRRRQPEAVKPLFRLLHDDNWYVRAEAGSALGLIGDPRAAGWLARLAGDGDGFVRFSAATALRQVACLENREVLLAFYDRAVGEQQLNVALALAKLAEPAALGRLTNAITNRDADVRRRVAEALGDYGPTAATNTLVLLLNDSDATVREEAGRSLLKVQQSLNGSAHSR